MVPLRASSSRKNSALRAACSRIGEFLFLDEGVFLQPFEQLRAVGGDHLGLRIVDVRVDETRHDQRAGEMFDRHARRQPRRQFVRRADGFDPAVLAPG